MSRSTVRRGAPSPPSPGIPRRASPGPHPDLRRKVRAGLDLIRTEPHAGKALRDELAGRRSLRIGNLRIIYRVGPERVIELVAIGPRRTIYAETFRLLRRK